MKKSIGKLINTIATIIIVLIILMLVPLTLPKVFGIKLYGIMTGSMEPEYKVGGVVYVKACDASDVEAGDVITYETGRGDESITHRVTSKADTYFVTKGDANNTTDPNPVLFTQMVGKVVFYVPYLAKVSDYVGTVRGLLSAICVVLICVVLWLVAGIISGENKAKKAARSEDVSGEAADKKKKSGDNLLIIGGSLLVVGALIYLTMGFLNYHRADVIYDDFEELLLEDESIEELTEEEVDAGLRDEVILKRLNVLKESYPDLIGYILIPGTRISYPIVQGEDDEYYLHHAYNGESNNSGAIFLTAYNNINFSEIYQILYGHNMRIGTMFGGLHKYEQEEDYLKEHPRVYIYTLDDVKKYDIFSYYNVDAEDEIYNIFYQNIEDFKPVFEKMVARSAVKTDVNPEYSQGILTLSTCNGSTGRRFVVHAARVWE